MAVPATINATKLKATFKLETESKFFPHLSIEALPVHELLGGLEKVISSFFTSWNAGLIEGKEFFMGLKEMLSLDLYSIK